MKTTGAWESAAEERHQKLLEYLAAKGKLKPPNPKPYLRDATNRPPAARVQSLKAGVIVRQKENLHISSAKPKKLSTEYTKKTRGPAFRPSKTAAPEKLQNVPQKPVVKVHSHPSGSSTRKVAQKGGALQQQRLGSARAQGLPSAAGVNKAQLFGKHERSKTAIVQPAPIHVKVKSQSHIENQPLNTKHVEEPTLGVSNNDAITRDPLIKTKTNREQVRGVSAVTTACVTGHRNTTVSRTTLRSSTARSASRNGAHCTDDKSSSRQTSKAADPPRRAQKPPVPTMPPPRKALAAAACRTRPSEKLQPERKVAKVKPIMGAAGNRCSSSGKTWSTIRTERAKNTEVPARPTAAGCVKKNNTTMCSKPKTETVESTLHKSKDPIPRRHSLGTAESAAFGRSESRGALPFTPAPWAAAVPPRKAVTEIKPGQDSKHLSAKEIRRSKLQEWMNSKGKSYKRPAMTLPPKKPAKAKARLSFWAGIEEEDDLNSLAMKINRTLSDCLRLIDEGLPSETVQAALSKIPQAEKFAKYWMCKARLLERNGTFDVIGLYEQAVRSGAVPIEELRETIFDIMKNTNKKAKVVTFDLVPEEGLTAATKLDPCEAQALPQNDKTVDHLVRSPNILTRQWAGEQGSALKFQIAPLPRRVKEPTVAPAWSVLTPVRRSLRIERSVSRYPETLMEHDTVVASLNDLLDADESCFVYRQNEALPKEVDSKIRAL